jgi:hypothetical protein
MTSSVQPRIEQRIAPPAATTLWIALIAALCVGGSYAYACAAPFAAIATLAAAKMDRRAGLALVVVSWIVNQAVGFAFLDYPHTANTFAWGLAIGVGAIVSYAAARTITEAGKSKAITLPLAFIVAFVAYEATLYAASFPLGGSDYAFSLEIVWYILKVNAVAFASLLLLHRGVLAMIAWLRPASVTAPVAT